MRALVLGAEGQLGRALVARLGADLVWAGGRAELDVTDPAAVARRLSQARPEVVFNAAAWNAVDLAETRFAEALLVNAAGPAYLARAAGACGARLVHVSSDYVFDGRATRPYREDDPAHPLSLYGVSKLAGERAVSACGDEHLVVRTSAVLGLGASRAKGGSFVERILARARAGQPLRVVTGQAFSPTCAPDLAAALLALAARGARGLVHVTNSGSCSWHALAVAALELAGVDHPVAEISSAELGAPARRPVFSVLSGERYAALGLPPLRAWREALADLLRGA